MKRYSIFILTLILAASLMTGCRRKNMEPTTNPTTMPTTLPETTPATQPAPTTMPTTSPVMPSTEDPMNATTESGATNATEETGGTPKARRITPQ